MLPLPGSTPYTDTANSSLLGPPHPQSTSKTPKTIPISLSSYEMSVRDSIAALERRASSNSVPSSPAPAKANTPLPSSPAPISANSALVDASMKLHAVSSNATDSTSKEDGQSRDSSATEATAVDAPETVTSSKASPAPRKVFGTVSGPRKPATTPTATKTTPSTNGTTAVKRASVSVFDRLAATETVASQNVRRTSSVAKPPVTTTNKRLSLAPTRATTLSAPSSSPIRRTPTRSVPLPSTADKKQAELRPRTAGEETRSVPRFMQSTTSSANQKPLSRTASISSRPSTATTGVTRPTSTTTRPTSTLRASSSDKEIAAWKAKVSELEKTIKQKDAHIESLSLTPHSDDTSAQELENAQKDAEEARKVIASLKKDILAAQVEAREVREGLRGRVEELEKQIAMTGASAKAAEEAQTKIVTLKEKLATLEQQLSTDDLEARVEEARKSAQGEAEKRVYALERELDAKGGVIASLGDELRKLNESKERELADVKAHANDAKNRAEKLEGEAKKQAVESEELRQKLDKTRKDVEAAGKNVKLELEEKHAKMVFELRKEIEKQQAVAVGAVKAKAEVEAEFKKQAEEVNSLRQKLAQAEKDVDSAVQKTKAELEEKHNQALEALREELEAQRKANSELQSKHSDEMKALKNELNAQDSIVADARAQVGAIEKELREEIATLEEASNREDVEAAVKEALEKLDAEWKAKHDKEIIAVQDDRVKQITALRSDLEETRKELDAITVKRDTAVKEATFEKQQRVEAIEELRKEHEKANKELTEQLKAREKEIDEMKSVVADVRAKMEQSTITKERELEDMRHVVEEVRAKMDKASREADEMRKSYESTIADFQKRIADSAGKDELEQLKEELEKARQEKQVAEDEGTRRWESKSWTKVVVLEQYSLLAFEHCGIYHSHWACTSGSLFFKCLLYSYTSSYRLFTIF
ncbi:hypothetical protein G7K_5624-t1 [Saitoella complicata NRRL Y-17804]|uniref:Uncharacterized protein n=1 Tax=Saitoella complicata (strain BCRC 22490 / CBS 7301 / JCM 7358 / NBRC 10748 / NRRL Y-17804) TaxID=698492 RepID=A0A0E9NQ23_SAICN|nr:hypothetical protein G7K_5624-t1 [Saitoella complicata NRRL Y-17804]